MKKDIEKFEERAPGTTLPTIPENVGPMELMAMAIQRGSGTEELAINSIGPTLSGIVVSEVPGALASNFFTSSVILYSLSYWSIHQTVCTDMYLLKP